MVRRGRLTILPENRNVDAVIDMVAAKRSEPWAGSGPLAFYVRPRFETELNDPYLDTPGSWGGHPVGTHPSRYR